MKYLLDTHLLIWSALGLTGKGYMSKAARGIISDPSNELYFSAASIWEVAIKRSTGTRSDIPDPSVLERGLRANEFNEIVVDSLHALGVTGMALHHRDPFDRLLISQASCEGMWFLTQDQLLAKYADQYPIKLA